MNKRNRDRLLSFARWLDRRASGIRAYVKRATPKRKVYGWTKSSVEDVKRVA